MVPTIIFAGCAPALVSRLVCSRFSSGAFFYFRVFLRGVGVRPAAHISLSSLAALAGSEISASVASAAADRLQVTQSDDMYSENDPAITITYTANNNYYINSITINSQSIPLTNTSEPASYSSMTGTQYKVWRSGASVVEIRLINCTADVAVVGDVGQTLTYTTAANVSISSYTRNTYDTTTATITGTTTATYSPQFSYNGNAAVTLYSTSGSGTVGGISYSYSRSGTNNTNFSITLSNLPTGYNNIPTFAFTAINSVTITFNTNDSTQGTISHSTGNYTIGDTITVYAAPKQDCAFLYWMDESGAYYYDNPLTITIGTAKTYTAYFSSNVLENVAVVAEYGGSVELVGEDFNNLQPTDEITLVSRVKITGYRFVGWYDGETLLGTSASIRLPYSQVQGKLITARFEYVGNSNMNDSTNTDNDFA